MLQGAEGAAMRKGATRNAVLALALFALEHFPLVMKRIRRCGSNWRILGV